MAAPTPGTPIAHAGNPTTSATITLGTTAADDILILVAVNAGATTALTPAGTYSGGAWNATGLAAAMTASWGGSWWSRCTGNHTGQTIVIGTATDSCSAAVMPVSGCLTGSSPLDTNTSATTLTANGLALAAFTTTVADTLVVYLGAWDDNIAPSAVTKDGVSMTLTAASSTGGADSGVMIARLSQASAGTTGAFAGTHASTLSKRLMAFALKPPAAAPQSLPLDVSAATSTTALALSNPTLLALGSADAISTTALTLTAPVVGGPELLPLQAADAVSGASLGLRADDHLQLAPAASTSTTALELHAPDLLQLAPASATSTTALDLHAPDHLQLDAAAGVASTSLTVTTPGPVPLNLAPAASTATTALALRTDDHLQLAAATATATTALALTAPELTLLALGIASAVSTTALVLTAAGPPADRWISDTDEPWSSALDSNWTSPTETRWRSTLES